MKRRIIIYLGFISTILAAGPVGTIIKTGSFENMMNLGTYLDQLFVAYFIAGYITSVVGYVILILVGVFLSMILFPVFVMIGGIFNRLRIAFGMR